MNQTNNQLLKIGVVILLTCCLQLGAAGATAQRISLSLKEKPLQEVFTEILRQTGISIIYNEAALKHLKPVSIQVKEATPEEVLNKCMDGQPLSYQLNGNRVIIRSKAAPANSQQEQEWTITGKVQDSTGMPIPGVSLRVRGKNSQTVSAADGTFRIKGVDAGNEVEVSSIGYLPQVLVIRSQAPLVVRLTSSVTNLSTANVVSTGYQVISKERTTGSFSKPDDAIFKNRSGSMNIVQRIEGLVPGLTINNAPSPVKGNNILIRGLASISDNTSHGPLLVVDGIPMDDINAINPQDVEDITVLKDATAASIWGARASNGVIVITTKKGKESSRLSMEYDGFVNLQGRPDLKNMPVLSSRQFIDEATAIFSPDLANNKWSNVVNPTNLTGVPPHEMILYNQYRGLITAAQAKSQLDSLAGINNLDQISDLWYRSAALTNHTLSVRGGTSNYGFYGSMAYTGVRSSRPTEKNNTFKLNLRQDLQFNKHIKAYLITDLTNTQTFSPPNIIVNGMMLPYQLFQDANGKHLSTASFIRLQDSTRGSLEKQSGVSLDYIPLDEMNYGQTNSNAMLARVTGGLTAQLLKGLRYEGVYGYLKGSNRTTVFDSEQSYRVREELVQFTVAVPGGKPVYYLPSSGGRYTVANTLQTNWTVRNQLIYDQAWRQRTHQLTLLAGQEATEQLTNYNTNQARGYDPLLQTAGVVDYKSLANPGINNPVLPNSLNRSVLNSDSVFAQAEIKARSTSYYANAAYTWKLKYALNASWRIDESNLFGRDKSAQNRPVWSVGGKWTASSESFLAHTPWLQFLALRVTYGITGNSPNPGTAASFDILAPRTNGYFYNNQGLYIASPANNRLTWESTATTNIGVDFSILNDRLKGAVDVYQRATTNLIGNMSLNPFTGYGSVIGNLGDIVNKGVEISVQSMNVHAKDFSWSTVFTLGYNRNRITKLNMATPITTGRQLLLSRFVEGYPAVPVFGYDYAGLNAQGNPQINAGGKITADRNVAKPADILLMGTAQSPWSGGFSNTFTYRSFSLSANIIYNLGAVMRRDVNSNYSGGRLIQSSSSPFSSGNPNAEFANRWRKPGDEALTDIPKYIPNASISNAERDVEYYTAANTNIVSASYMKFRDISLFYSLPAQLVQRLKSQAITFRFQVSNVMLWKANQYDIDPEFMNALGGTVAGGIRAIPVNQGTFTFGAHVSF
ncbi:SusC/RagA family TonB-linked outer membrane protein [Chitinophaga sp. sic0106]|uniref:SusC/RagA family TonB-linked outer membrane protein n=1 Tax=Chitinophaga sp. sic0106 TaxID=2854785 RepID=UPI001C450F38|nr:SusC/RagA family TonB-linked outer membrane protein [Chitinophaga sp. sic0106]MBV7531050.1 SusC/RagA family TonB-linked outer membrane protein [Chitinophaga sp. sic0106]